MITDKENEFCAALAVTVSAMATDHFQSSAARDIGNGKSFVAINVDEDFTADGAGTLTFQLVCDSDPAFGSKKIVSQSKAFPKAELLAGRETIYLPVPPGLDEANVGLYFEVGTGPMTGGKVSAGIVLGRDQNKAYPNAIN